MNDSEALTLARMELATNKRKLAGLRQIVRSLETRLMMDNGGELPRLPGPDELLPSQLLPEPKP